ncbi:MAG: hypothetical protein KC505_08215 [Myxococcales bacterium]|nr:hypothetical protein [Myxococcales bacterium]USN51293.1 MAG: hypothetical protein H6731_02495 [Myxococcales bacterium]
MATSRKNLPNKSSPEISKDLSFEEETVIRLNKGIANIDMVLERKSKNPEILARLEQMEREIMARAKDKGIIK